MATQDLILLRKIHRKRTISLHGLITLTRTEFVKRRLIDLSRGSEKPIRLNISSRGGSFHQALELHDAIRECRAPVVGVASKAHSGALLVLQGCQLRIGRVGATFVAEPLFHDLPIRITPFTDPEVLGSVVSEHFINTLQPFLLEEWRRAHSILLEKVLEAERKTSEDLQNLLVSDPKLLSEKEALKWGFIDMVKYRP